MSINRARLAAFGCICLVPLTLGITCAPAAPADNDGNGDQTPQLTAAEEALVLAALRSAGGIVQASGISQSAANGEEDSAQVSPSGLTAGTCPEVTVDSTLGEGTLDVVVDFGSGCTLVASPEFACAGSAEGRLDTQGRLLDLTFNSISCSDERSLSGEVAIAYEKTEFDLLLEGQWDLTYRVGTTTVQTTGSGTTNFDAGTPATTIREFEGTVTQDTNQWDIAVDALELSFIRNGNFIPYAGTISVSGPNVRSLTIRFNANSPSTGDFEVSINGSDFISVNLAELAD